MGQNEKIIKGEAVPTVTVTDLITRKVMIISVHEGYASVELGKETINITGEQVIAVMQLIQQQMQFVKPLTAMQVKEEEEEENGN